MEIQNLQITRFVNTSFITNAEISSKHIEKFCPLTPISLSLLKQAVEKLSLSARSYHRTIKVARTIADLADSETIESIHIAEALQFRPRNDLRL